MYRSSLWLVVCMLGVFVVSSCNRSGCDVWEDTKSASRYMGKGMRKLGGKQGRDCGEVCNRDEFCHVGDYDDDYGCDFEPLQDAQAQGLVNMEDLRLQPRRLPGEPGCPVPDLEAFQNPSSNPEHAKIFQNIHFDYDKSIIKGDANIDRLRRMADYLRSHQNTYVFVEGHCDQNGGQKYNHALGTRRANAVRKLLIEFGVDKDRIFAITYGKDRLLRLENTEEAYKENRRVQFKIYET